MLPPRRIGCLPYPEVRVGLKEAGRGQVERVPSRSRASLGPLALSFKWYFLFSDEETEAQRLRYLLKAGRLLRLL